MTIIESTSTADSRGRFEFGKNWAGFLENLSEKQIGKAERSLSEMLGLDSLRDKTFLDVGSGSGLFSLAARMLGAAVHSFDYDVQSVSCTAELKRRYFINDGSWTVERGSVLDSDFLSSMPLYDIVYSWGVLHHTGEMWKAMDYVTRMVAPDGYLYISIYNDQGTASRLWRLVKGIYNGVPRIPKHFILVMALLRLWGPTILRDIFRYGHLRTWSNYSSERGMSPWYDTVDWVGGYPFEVARPGEVITFFSDRGFTLMRTKLCGRGRGCNEFVFRLQDGSRTGETKSGIIG